jgi:glutaredoxin-related protein
MKSVVESAQSTQNFAKFLQTRKFTEAFNSSRRIKSLAIDGLFRFDKYSQQQLKEVFSRINTHIVELKYRNSEAAQVFQFINLMPNIEVLELVYIKYENLGPFRVKLPKLREVSTKLCSFRIERAFNRHFGTTLCKNFQ